MSNKNNKNNKKTKESFVQSRNRLYRERDGSKNIGPVQHASGMLGAGIGSFFGQPVPGFIAGNAIGHGVGWITGTGDYRTNFKSISSNACTVPSFSKSDSTTIIHREYIQDITASSTVGAFKIESFPLNPGVTETFPWLAQIAANYEEYDIQGMVFEFNSTSGNSVASTNTAIGTVIMATQYDPTKPAFENKQAMENYSFATSIKPSESFLHAVECKKVRTPVKQLYIRTGANTGSDLRWTDFGNFSIATFGIPGASTNLGELWCSYKIRLSKPRLPITLGFGGQIPSFYVRRSGVVTGGSTGNTTVSTAGPLAVTLLANSVSWEAIPNQTYLVAYSVTAATSVATITAAVSANMTSTTFYPGGLTSMASGGGLTNGQFVGTYVSATTAPNQVAIFTFGAHVVVGAAEMTLTITELDSTI